MIEDELRTLLAARAGAVPANLHRAAEVRARIGGIRRRRAAEAAFALVLIALAGLLLTRLPGRPDALPTGVPPGPWIQADGRASIPGYEAADAGLMGELDGPRQRFLTATGVPLRRLVVVRCERRGQLVVRNLAPGGPSVDVDCSRRFGDHYEGVAVIEPEAAGRLFAQVLGEDCCNVEFAAVTPGRWAVGLFVAIAPDHLGPRSIFGSPFILDGAAHPDGGTVTITVPRKAGGLEASYGFSLTADCVEGVQLTVTVQQGPLGVLTCDQGHGLSRGQIQSTVEQATLDRYGLRLGDQVRVTVRSTGRSTGEWRLYAVDF